MSLLLFFYVIWNLVKDQISMEEKLNWFIEFDWGLLYFVVVI